MANASDFKVKKGLQVEGGDVNLGGGDTAGVIQVDVADSGVGLDLTISAGESASGAGGSLKLQTAATTSLADRLVISPTTTTISDGSFDFDIASHDGSNGLKLGGTLVTTTAAELNLIDGGTARGTTAVASGDGVLINDAGTMRMTNVDTLAAYFDDQITSMPNLATAAGLTSVGTLTALTVDDVAIDGKVITMTGSSNDTAVITAAANGALSIVTTDAAAAAANIQITADGTVDIDSTGVLTLDSGAAINIEPATGSAILLDGTISVDAGVVTGATSITSTAFVGDLTGTLQTAAQGNVTSLGTLTALTVDDVAINGKVITMTGSTSDTAVFTVGTDGTLDIATTDAAGTDADIQISADGTAELAGTTVTLDSAGGITLDADGGTITFADGGSQLTTITSLGAGLADHATNVQVSDSSADETAYPVFVDGATGKQALESDTALNYNPSSGHLTATLLSGTLQTAAQANVTSLGTLTALTGVTGDLNWDAKTLWVDSSENGVGIGPSSQINAGVALTVMGAVSLKEAANPSATDVAGYGQLWVKTATPNQLYFTTDAGNDIQLTSGTAIASGGAADSVAADDISDGDAQVDIETSTGGVNISADAVNQTLTLGNTTGPTVINGLTLDVNSAGVSTVDAVTSHVITAPIINLTASNSMALTTPVFKISSSGASRPVFTVEGSAADATSPTIELRSTAGSGGSGVGEDDDTAGTITFSAKDAGDADTVYGRIKTVSSAATAGSEEGTMTIGVATTGNGAITDIMTLKGNANAAGSKVTIAGDLQVDGTTTTVNQTEVNVTNAFVFEGANANAYETTLTIVEPTADRTINLPDAAGTIAVAGGAGLTLSSAGSMSVDASQTQITSVGALNAGSITSGFGTIDTGSSNITTTGTVAAGPITSTGLTLDSTVLMDTYSATLTSDSATTMFTLASNAYSAGKVLASVWLDDGNDNRSVTEFLFTYVGASTPAATGNIHMTEYALVDTSGSQLATFDVVKDSGNILVQITPDSSTSTKVRAQITQFVI